MTAAGTAESYRALRDQLASEGRLFEDEDFPATDASIYYVLESVWEGIEWKRPGELCENPKFQHEGSTRFDLAQGDLGNCWFLSAATTLALHPDLFVKVVPADQSFEDNYAGLFYFSFWRYGEWMDVVVDDRLPVKNGRLAFCHNRSQSDEFWGALLEKAYAKIHGSYQSLETGYSHDALVDFTGGIGEFIDLVREQDSANRIFKTLKRSFKMNSMICAAIDIKEGGGYEDKLDNGLVTGHAYSITNVAELTVDGQNHRLLRLRNPWGRKEWTGAWSDGSDRWSAVSDEDRERCDLRTEDDGEFWMSFEDLMANYSSASICHLTPDSVQTINTTKKSWHVASHHGSWVPGISAGGCGAPPNMAQYWSNPQYTVRVVDPDETDDVDTCTVVVSLMQKYRRQHKTMEHATDNTEESIGFDLLKFRRPEEEGELDEGNHDSHALQMERRMLSYEYLRERACRFTVQPGVYCLIPCTYLPDVEGEFLLRVATEQPLESEQLGSTGQSESTNTTRKSKFDRLFTRFAGDDEAVDAKEMRQMMNKGLLLDGDEAFTKETSRAVLAWAKFPEKGGTMDYAQCKKAWSEVRRLQDTFHEFDVDDSNTLNRSELRKAFKAVGLTLSKSTLGAVTMHFCGKQKGLVMDEFIMLGTRISTLFSKYERKGQNTGMTIDEWLETTLLV